MTETLSALHGAVPRLGAFAARLSRGSRLYLETAGGLELPQSGRGRRYWVVSRGRSRFFRAALLPAADRTRQLDAIGLEIRRLSPFAEPGSHLHLGADFAGVWLWDQAATRATGLEAGIEPDRLRIVPEAALHPALPDGVWLVESLDGVDGQYWLGGGLAVSRWWPHVPDERAWIAFQRGAAVPPGRLSPAVPVPLRPAWLDRPWTRTRSGRAFDPARLDLRVAAAIVGLLALAGYGFAGAQYVHAARSLAALDREVAARSAAVDPILSARTRALDNLTAIRALHGLAPFPSQLALMARVAELLPTDGARLNDWLYDRGQLELSIADDHPLEIVRLVRALETDGPFREVAADRTGNNNTVRLRAAVVPQ